MFCIPKLYLIGVLDFHPATLCLVLNFLHDRLHYFRNITHLALRWVPLYRVYMVKFRCWKYLFQVLQRFELSWETVLILSISSDDSAPDTPFRFSS